MPYFYGKLQNNKKINCRIIEKIYCIITTDVIILTKVRYN